MSDRELLELAAKAAGIKIRWQSYGNYFVICDIDDEGIEAVWNPVLDDGDALRLAVKLRLDVGSGLNLHSVEVCMVSHAELFGGCFEEAYDNDPYAATRRAIVRAAAEIGRNMK